MATPGNIVLRDAIESEADDVASLLGAAYGQYGPTAPTAGRFSEAAWNEYLPEILDVRGRWKDGSILIVAEREDALLGAVTFYPPGASSEWPAGWAGIRLLGVLPSARFAGIGRALTEECIRRAHVLGASGVGLHTAEVMEVARGMYERMGFERMPENDFWPEPTLTVMAYRLTL